MDALTLRIRGNYVVPDVKEILISSASDVSKLPTSTKVGTFESENANYIVGIGSVAYTADMSSVYQLNLNDEWVAVTSSGGSGGGGSTVGVSIDDTLSETSTNPVQNKVITTKLSDMEDEITANSDAITAETTAREKAVTDEAEARATAVTDEATARQEADEVLQSNIDTLSAKVNALPQSLPEATAADAGKVLRVSSEGTWELVDISTIGDIT